MTIRTRELEESLERTRAETDARIERLLSVNKQRAEATLADARATADRVRAESERELAAASQRRDSINSQLAHVRPRSARPLFRWCSGSGPPCSPLVDRPARARLPRGGDTTGHRRRAKRADVGELAVDAVATLAGGGELALGLGTHAVGRAGRVGQRGLRALLGLRQQPLDPCVGLGARALEGLLQLPRADGHGVEVARRPSAAP